MILLIGVAAGLLGGGIRAAVNKRTYQPYPLRLVWLVFLAITAQWFAFSFPLTRSSIPELGIRLILVLSQLALLIFTAANIRTPGFWVLGTGLVLNLLVISLNGGWMPISPETVQWLVPGSADSWQVGERLGYGKDIVLLKEDTILWFLSDLIHTPVGWSYKVAFSIGDIVIALGAFWLFWSIGGRERVSTLQENQNVSNYLPPSQ